MNSKARSGIIPHLAKIKMIMTGSKLLLCNHGWEFADYIDWRGDSNYRKAKHFGKSLRMKLKENFRNELKEEL